MFTLATIIVLLLLLSIINRSTEALNFLPSVAYPVFIGLVSGFVCGYLSPFQYKKAAFAAALTIIALGAIPLLLFMQKSNESQASNLGDVFLVLIILVVMVLLFILSVFLAVFLIVGAVIGSNIKKRKLGKRRSMGKKRSAKPQK